MTKIIEKDCRCLTDNDAPAEALALSKEIQSLFRGRDPAIVSAALADLTSMWLAGHRKDDREGLLRQWTECVRLMTEVSVMQVFRNKPPPGWEP